MPQLNENEVIYCKLCGGSGKIDEFVWDKYTPASKSGHSVKVSCTACSGVGKFIDSVPWVFCSLCDGTGRIGKTVWDENTPTSKSSHIERVPCTTCGGVGKVRPRSIY